MSTILLGSKSSDYMFSREREGEIICAREAMRVKCNFKKHTFF